MNLDILEKLPPEEALVILEALDKKRRDESYIRYWKATVEQEQAIKQFTSGIKVFGLLGGNRSGKTELGAFIALAWFLGKDYFRDEPAWELVKDLPIPPDSRKRNVWVVGLDFNLVRDVLWREKFMIGREHPRLLPLDEQLIKRTSEQDFQIFHRDGHTLTCKSADSGREKFQGASVDLVWIDEECEQEVYDECYQRTVDCGGHILITLTPLTDTASGARVPWVFDLHREAGSGKAPDTKFARLSVFNNPYVPEEEKLKLRQKWAGHFEEKARLYGEFIQRSGLIYPMWSSSKHLVGDFRIPSEWLRVACIDPAATGPTAVLWCAVENATNSLYFYREYLESEQVVSEHAKAIRIANAGDPVDVWLIDPKWGSQRNAETHKTGAQLYRESGIPVRLAVLAEDYGINASLEYMQATITGESARHPKAYFFKSLKDFQFEIEHYHWDFYRKGDQKGQSKEKPFKRDDHLLNCYQYICAMRPKSRSSNTMGTDFRRSMVGLNSYT